MSTSSGRCRWQRGKGAAIQTSFSSFVTDCTTIEGGSRPPNPRIALHKEIDIVLLLGKTILVVKDDFFLAEALSYDLEDEGACILGPVASVAEALDILASRALDGAVLDVNLRQDRIYPVSDILLRKGTPFVLLTGASGCTEDPKFRGAPVFFKPGNTMSLIKRLESLI